MIFVDPHTINHNEFVAADHANHMPAAGHGNPLDVTALHHFDHRVKRLVLSDRPWIGRHNLFDFSARGVHVFLGKPAGPENEFEPSRSVPAAPQKIAFGHACSIVKASCRTGFETSAVRVSVKHHLRVFQQSAKLDSRHRWWLNRPQGRESDTAHTGYRFDINKVIDYPRNSRDIFSRYPDRPALPFVVDYAPQFGNTAAHYHVQ